LDWLLENVLRNILKNEVLPTNTSGILLHARMRETGSVEDRRFGKRMNMYPKSNHLLARERALSYPLWLPIHHPVLDNFDQK